jgi:hypothetical protein
MDTFPEKDCLIVQRLRDGAFRKTTNPFFEGSALYAAFFPQFAYTADTIQQFSTFAKQKE